jgi:hypothetical protein
MKKIMVRYKVKSDRVQENEKLIADVFMALASEAPAGLRYASFKLEDGVSFVHLVSFETDNDDNPLGRMPAFAAFTAGIRERCDDPPMAGTVSVVGQYRMFPG